MQDPDNFVTIGSMMKATPREEGGRRIIYLEASQESSPDYQREVVLQKALSDSSGYFLRHGNIDLDHLTVLGPRQGIANHMDYEVGRPVQVSMHGKSTFVKGELCRGESGSGRNGEMVWDSLTKQSPAARWYPSVGGAILDREKRLDPETQQEVTFIKSVRWNNLALTRTPVHRDVPEISITPIGNLAKAEPVGYFSKSLGGFFMKTLTAGYGTDSAQMAGGAALREQSLDGVHYLEFRERLAKSLRTGQAGANPGARELVDHCVKRGMSKNTAAEYVERFCKDLNKARKKT